MAKVFYNAKKYKRKTHKSYKPKGYGRKKNLATWIVSLFLLFSGAVVFFVILPTYTDYGIDIFSRSEPEPEVTPTPEPTQHPLSKYDTSELQSGVNVTDTTLQWFSDGYAYKDTLMFSAGQIKEDGDAYMNALMQVKTDKDSSKLASRVNIVLEYESIMNAVFNDDWLVYLDANIKGGGKIKCCKMNGNYTNPIVVKEVYTGYPALFLSGNNLAWIERTGTSMDKLFLCDLSTMESATVQTFNQLTCYGISKPHLMKNKLVWADVESENTMGAITSQICTLNIDTGEYSQFKPNTYVHDPKSDGTKVLAWMTGNHGLESDLYMSVDGGEPELIDEGIVDFYVDEGYIAYQKNLAIYIYIPSTHCSYRITKDIVSAQIMGASGGCVSWNEVSTGDRESIKFLVVPK